jgi:hypothetical protein
MTDAAPKRPRLSKRVLRAWAWIAGGIAFFSPWAVLGLSPKPATGAEVAKPPRQMVIVRKITRRVIIQDAPKSQPVRYVYAGGSSGSSVSGSSGSSGSTSSASTSTGGSHP